MRKSVIGFIKRLFISSSLSAIRVVPSVHLSLLIFLVTNLIPASAIILIKNKLLKKYQPFKFEVIEKEEEEKSLETGS